MGKAQKIYSDAQAEQIKNFKAAPSFKAGWYAERAGALGHYYTELGSLCGKVMGGLTSETNGDKCRKCKDAIRANIEGPELSPRLADNPDASPANKIAAFMRATPENKPLAAKATVMENARTRIGGLANIKAKRPHHEKAAELLKNMWEGIFGGDVSATDAGRVQVDTSKIAHDCGLPAKIDRSTLLLLVRKRLSNEAYELVIDVVCIGRSLAAIVGDGLPDREKRAAVVEKRIALLEALDVVAEIWKL